MDHDILLQKVIGHIIYGKLGMGIKNPAQMKIQIFHQEAKSRVPQSTVFASILFIIIITDIDLILSNLI